MMAARHSPVKTIDRPGSKSGAPRKAFSALSPVAQAVRPVLRRFLPQKTAVFQQLFDVWPQLTAIGEAKGSIPEKLQFARGKQSDGVLSVWALTGGQAMEMTFSKRQLIHDINTRFGFNVVSDLRVTAFPQGAQRNRKTLRSASGPAGRRDSLSCQSLDKIVSDISNPGLKAALVALGGTLGSATDETTCKENKNNSEKGHSHA